MKIRVQKKGDRGCYLCYQWQSFRAQACLYSVVFAQMEAQAVLWGCRSVAFWGYVHGYPDRAGLAWGWGGLSTARCHVLLLVVAFSDKVPSWGMCHQAGDVDRLSTLACPVRALQCACAWM